MINKKNALKFIWFICFCVFVLFSYFPVSEGRADSGKQNPEKQSTDKKSIDKQKNILIINTNSSVKKYNIAHKEFQNRISYPSSSINLNEEKWQIDDIKSIIQNKKNILIYCIGTKAYMLASKYAPDKDIVFSSIINWLRLPLTGSSYGVSNEQSPEMQILMLRYIFPDIKKIGVLFSKEYNNQWFINARHNAEKMGLEMTGISVSHKDEVLPSLKEILADIEIFWLISDPVIMPDKETLISLFKICDMEKKSIFSYHAAFAKYGAVLIVSPDEPTIGRQAARIAADLLEKKKIKEKVQFPAGNQIILNLKTINKYGLKYNEEILGTVNEIIK